MQDAIFTYVRLYNVCANLFLRTVPTNTSPAIRCTAYFPHFAVLHNFCHYTPLYTVPLYFSCRPLSGTGRLLKGFPRAFSSLHTLNNPSSLSLFSQGRCSSLLSISVALLGSGGPCPLVQVHVLLMLGALELDTVPQVGSQERGVYGWNYLP